MSDNLFSYFRSRFAAWIDAPFVEQPGGATVTYRDLVERTGQIAHLLASLGVGPGDRIAVHVDKSVDSLLLYLASLRGGHVYLPLNPAYTLAEVGYFLGDAAPSVLVCRPQDEAKMRELAARHGIWRVLTLGAAGEGSLPTGAAAQPSDFADVDRRADDLAAILYTSGTTGRSKGAMLTHANLQSNCDVLRREWRFETGDRLLHALPIFHTHGLFVATNVTLASGSAMIVLPRFDVRQVIEQLSRATVMMGVPTFYTRLLDEAGLDRDLVAHMRLFVSGSAPLGLETFKAFEARTGHRILERYGMTETNMNTSNPYDGERVPGSVGAALPGVELRIADAESAAGRAVGMIQVRGPNVFKGYWKMPEKTAEEFTEDGFFKTGDLGYVDEQGYAFIVGRAKDLIISGGFNVYPAEVEQVIEAMDGVAECAVIGVPHADLGEGVVAIVARSPASAISERDIVAALDATLARFKQPRRVAFVDELPRNGMGKVQKKTLREEYAALLSPSPPAPRAALAGS